MVGSKISISGHIVGCAFGESLYEVSLMRNLQCAPVLSVIIKKISIEG